LLFIAFSMRQMGAGWSRGLQETARFGLGVGAVYFMCLAVAAILV
jgi:hypothetical protein